MASTIRHFATFVMTDFAYCLQKAWRVARYLVRLLLGASLHQDHEVLEKKPVYQVTPYRFAPLKALPRSLTGSDSMPIEKVDLLGGYSGYTDACFLLRNLLTPSECKAIIEQAEGFGLQSCVTLGRFRVTDRVAVMGPELGDLIFARAKPYLPDMHISSELQMLPAGLRQDIAMAGAKQRWSSTELNPCFRVCKYQPGGFFQPHHDGVFDYSREHRSIKTFMIYLNDDFEGGPTNFYKESQKHYCDPDPTKVIHALRPERGSCLVFNHCLTHDGGVLKEGKKYILRTEVMYRLSP